MPYIVKTLKNNVTLPDGRFYMYAQSTAELTDDEYESIPAAYFSNGTLELVSGSPGGGSSGVLKAAVTAYITNGSGTLPDTANTWQPLAGFLLEIDAAVDDFVELGVHGMRSAVSTAWLDVAVLVGGAPVRYLATGTNTPAPEGDPGFYTDGGYINQSAERAFTVVAGDLDDGKVVFAVMAKTTANAGSLYASTTYPFYWQAKNYGPVG